MRKYMRCNLYILTIKYATKQRTCKYELACFDQFYKCGRGLGPQAVDSNADQSESSDSRLLS